MKNIDAMYDEVKVTQGAHEIIFIDTFQSFRLLEG